MIGPERQIAPPAEIGIDWALEGSVTVTDFITEVGHFRRIGDGPLEFIEDSYLVGPWRKNRAW